MVWLRTSYLAVLVVSGRCLLASGTSQNVGNPDCTTSSLSDPYWELADNITVTPRGSGKGDVEFLLFHGPTGQNATCVAKNVDISGQEPSSGETWFNCSVPNTSLSLDTQHSELEVRQSWTCDTSSKLAFDSKGRHKLNAIAGCNIVSPEKARPNGFICDGYGSTILGNLTSPVAIQPVPPQRPPPQVFADRLGPQCNNRPQVPYWRIQDFFLRHHFNATLSSAQAYYDVSLNVTNYVSRETVRCEARVDELPPVTTNGTAPWISCDSSASWNKSGSFTEIMVDINHGVLGVRQRWTCMDDKNVTFNGNGTGYLVKPFTCGVPVNQTTTDSNGMVVAGVSDYNCTLPLINLTGFTRPPDMPHTFYNRSCTINSFNTSSMVLQDYNIATSKSGNASGTKLGTFTILNPGSGDQYRLFRMPIQDDGNWHKCVAGHRPLPWQLVECQYQLDRKTNNIGFKFQWYCDDRDPSHAITFNATVGGLTPGEECNQAVGTGESNCHLKYSPQSADVKLPVSSLAWKSTSEPMDRGPILPWL